ncbi:DUF748 domain-containing protein [Shewanella psychrotolerans]|uniref:DUF748 domain-containing protein n=1 Tax=Shewanella psychrotolerans TaxID=2864206 RepID=UPI001C65E557|nr:DUF748 domain-containing protein [Shewanella psychrotolerans]QYK00189.1 DUF748 domain-containing protein [Shewanella psychrotolerans]
MSSVPSLFARLGQKYKRLPKYQRYIGITLSLYLTWTLLLGLLTPYLIVQQTPKQLSSLLNRPVALKDVSINPFTLAVKIDGFSIAEKDNSAFVGFEQLAFQYQFWHSLFDWGFSFTDVTLASPYANVRRVVSNEPLRFNFSDIIETLNANATDTQSQETEQTSQASQAIPHIMVTKLAIVDAALELADDVTQSQVSYHKVNLHVNAFDSLNPLAVNGKEDPQRINHYDIEFHGKNGGMIALKGQVQLSPLDVRGDITLSDIVLPQFWSLVAQDFTISLDQGYLDFSTDYRLAIDNEQLIAKTNSGELTLKQIAINHQQREIMTLDAIALHNINFDLTNKQVTIDALSSQNLLLNARVDNEGLNLVRLFTPKSMQSSAGAAATQPTEPALIASETVTAVETAQAVPTTANDDKLTANHQSELTSTNTSTSLEPQWSARLNAIEISGYQLALKEQLLNDENQWNIGDIKLTTGSIDAALSAPIDFELALSLNQQGQLATRGQIDAKSQKIQAQFTLTKLALNQFQNFLTPYLNIDLEQGLLSTQGELVADAEAQMRVNAAVQIDELSIRDNLQQQPLLKWHSLDINQMEFDKQTNALVIDQVTLTKPFGRVLIAEDRSTNFQGLVKDLEPQAEATPAEKAQRSIDETPSPMALSINNVIINGGSTFFADKSLTPNFAASIEQLSGSISNLSSSSKKAAGVDIKGKIDRYAPVTLKGEINPLLEQPYLDLDLSFKHVELTSVNPYSGTYAGYYIDKGLMSLDLNYQLENNQLVGDNHLVVDQLQLGKRSESSLATSLPVTLAIALLQDRNGVIDLGLQVSGDLNEPSFSFGSIVMTAFTNVITKAVTAPFSLLAGLLGSDDELDKVAFNVGSAALNKDSQSLLDKLAKGLKDRPKLRLSAKGAVNLTEDSQALMSAQLQQKLAQTANLDIAALPAGLSPSTYPTSGVLSDALKRLYETELGLPADEIKQQIETRQEQKLSEDDLLTRWHMTLYNSLLSHQDIGESALGTLAQQRAVTVKHYLIEQAKIEPGRIFVLDSQADLNTSASQALLTLSAD